MQGDNVSRGIGIAVGVAVYLAFIGGIIALAFRWSRRILERKRDALGANLAAAGGRVVGAAPSGGLYTGRETEYEVQGRRVFIDARYVSRDFVRANVRVEGGPFPYVTLYPEGALQRFGKAIALTREVQLGDDAFDKAVYIDSPEKDDARVRALLLAQPVRDTVRELLAMGFKVQFSSRGVEAYQIVYALRGLDGVPTAQVASRLTYLAEHAPRFDGATLTPEPSRRPPPVLWLALAGVAAGVGLAAGLSGASGSHLLDDGDNGLAFLIGCGLWVLAVVAVFFAVRGRSSAMTTLLGAALVGLFVLPCFGGMGLAFADRALDPSAGEGRWVTVQRKHSKQHDLHVASWRPGRAEETVYTTHDTWEQIQPGDAVRVVVHPGLFGWPWTERVTEFRHP
ncbi:MAG: hypothetical protein R3A52_21340 [Polyangiales bacterium]